MYVSYFINFLGEILKMSQLIKLPEGIQFPKFKCHKVVGASQIISMDVNERNSEDSIASWSLFLNDLDEPLILTDAVVAQYSIVAGGYIVQYSNNYFSFSPEKDFEDGYSPLIEETNIEPETQQIIHSYNIVRDMNTAFGNHSFTSVTMDWGKMHNQCKNIKDEIKELISAIYNVRHHTYITNHASYVKNMEKVRDALCDIQVFAFGAFHFIDSSPLWVGETILEKLNETGISLGLTPSNDSALFNAYLQKLDVKADLLMRQYDLLEIHFEDVKDHHMVEEIPALLDTIATIISMAWDSLKIVGVLPILDMVSVINGVMTRFVKDEVDLEATKAKHAAKGITEVYTEGDFPTMILKSAIDQPDAPKGKFLKSASFSEPEFVDIYTDLGLDQKQS